MDYEKKYKEALEVAQRFYNNSAAITKKGLEDIFPELKESEDERIRKGLIEYFLHYPDHEIAYYGLKADFVIAWLEKQGNNNMGISEATKKKLEDNLNKALEKETPESWNEFLDEQKPVEWHREDEQNLNACLGYIPDEFLRRWLTDIIHVKYDKPAWSEKIKGLNELETYILSLVPDRSLDAIKVDAKNIRYVINKEQKPSWSEEDEAIYYGVIETEQYMLDVVNGIKKFNVGNISIKEECTRELNWLKSLKDRALLKPKQEWSEEDDKNLKGAIQQMDLLEEYINDGSFVTEVAKQFSLEVCRSVKNWLKSLRPQNRWKPSDEQMDMLAKVCSTLHLTSGENEIMESIYDALKKLKA